MRVPSPRISSGLALALLSLCAVLSVVSATTAPPGEPPTVPQPLQTSKTPVGNFPQPPLTPPLTVLPTPAAAVPRVASFDDGSFPSGPFKNQAPKSNVPPPLAPSGRWLFSMLRSGSEIFVYGGVGSYSTLLYNDLWMYSFVEDAWSQLHTSYVPPFPLRKKKGSDGRRGAPLEAFRPPTSPPQPAMKEGPPRDPTMIGPMPGSKPPGAGPVLDATPKTPVPVVEWTPIEIQPLKMPSTDAAFLQLEETMIRRKPFASARPAAAPIAQQTVETPSSQQDDLSLLQTKSRTRAALRSKLRGRSMQQMKLLQRMQLENRHYLGVQTEAQTGVLTAAHVNTRLRAMLSSRLGVNLELKGQPNPEDNYSKMNPFISADLWKYNLETKVWVSVFSDSPNIPAPRWLHSAVTVGGRMVIFGGVSYSDIILGDVWVFNPDNNSWMKATPSGPTILPREGHSACVLNDFDMYVFGGISYSHVPFNDLWNYETKKNAWSLVKPKGSLVPPPRWMHTATQYRDDEKNVEYMIIFGGVTRNWIPLDDLWIFDSKAKQWSHPKVAGYPPFPRMLHSATVVGKKFLVYAGVANNIPFDDLWFFDMDESTWSEHYPSTAYPFAREGHGMVNVAAPAPEKQAAVRPEWTPPDPASFQGDPLTPLIKNFTSERPINRYRKDNSQNSWLVIFGGAGPKPREEDFA